MSTAELKRVVLLEQLIKSALHLHEFRLASVSFPRVCFSLVINIMLHEIRLASDSFSGASYSSCCKLPSLHEISKLMVSPFCCPTPYLLESAANSGQKTSRLAVFLQDYVRVNFPHLLTCGDPS